MKIKNVIVYIIVCIIIFVSFKIPDIILNKLEDDIEITKFEKQESKVELDIEAESIYLVETIHNIEDQSNNVEITSNKNTKILVEPAYKNETNGVNVINELTTLEQYKILNDLQINKNQKCNIGIIDKYYQKDKKTYIIKDVTFETNDKQFNLEIESKTGKILDISTKKGNINTKDKMELMINYIKYLDLNIIDDWNYENNTLKSEKAKLVVSLAENDSKYDLSIHSTERSYNYIDIYKYK